MFKLVLLLISCVCANNVPVNLINNFPETVPLPKVDPLVYKDYRLALDAIFSLAIRAQAFLGDDNHENFLVSPLSAAVLVGQLMLGADKDFGDDLVDLLYLPTSEKVSMNKNTSYELPYSTFHLQMSGLLNNLGQSSKQQFVLKQNSALFVNDNVKLNRRFKLYLKSFYLTQVYALNFTKRPEEALNFINTWAKQNTNGLINTIITETPSAKTSSIFTNAIYFFAEWQYPFSDLLNRDGVFNVNLTKSVPVTYMAGLLEQILYVESKHYKMICLPYKNEELGMYIMLPHSEGPYKFDMKNFVRTLNATEVAESIARGKRTNVTVKIPKMSLSHTLSLMDKLKKYKLFKKYGMPNTTVANASNVIDVVKNNVDKFNNFTASTEDQIFLTKAAYNGNLIVNDIVQQVIVNINEKGTEAAAVTASTVDYILSKNFLVDRPFTFFIRHEATSATLFWGTIANPKD